MITKEQLFDKKYDLEKIASDSLQYENEFNMRLWDKYSNETLENESGPDVLPIDCSAVSLWVRASRSSFIAPAYDYNEFIDSLVLDAWWDDIKHSLNESEWISSTLREHKKNIVFQNCLLSIKMGLDRFVSLFSLYYKGFSNNSTFGHMDCGDNGRIKAKGFMSYVLENKDKDDVLRYIYDQYWKWIKECVFPRDAIMHYQDSFTSYSFIWNEEAKKGIEMSVNVSGGKNDKYICVDYEKLRFYTNQYYAFFEQIMKYLSSRDPI